ncbi:MAG: hypothetical protein V1899_06275, partial [Planctomycetota bacterium]
GHAYFGTYTNPGIVVKVKLADFTRADAVTLNYDERLLGTAVMVPGADYAYFMSGSCPGRCIKIALNNAETTWTHAAPLKVAGNLNIGAGTLNSAGQNVTVAGNWINAGEYIPGLNTVTLDGGNQTVSGTNTFYNLTKTVTSAASAASAASATTAASATNATNTTTAASATNATSTTTAASATSTATLTFESNKYQHVAGTLNLQGNAGLLLSLRASVVGKPWRLITSAVPHVAQASCLPSVQENYQTVRYADIKDTNASEGRPIVALRSVNSGNNKNVIFTAPARVAFSTSSRSVTNPAWVEGKNSEDTTGIAVSVNNGASFAATRLTAGKWFANNTSAGASTGGVSITGTGGGSSGGSNVIGSGGALGVTLSPTAATHVTVTASNPFGDVGAATQNITWTATDLKGKSFSADTLRIRRGDSLLLTASGAGKKLTIAVVVQASCLPPKIDFSGAPGNRFAYRYDTPGVYVAQAWIDGIAVGSLTVIVIEVNMNKDLASQVLFERINDITKDMTINPISPISPINQVTQLPAIWFGSNDATLLKAFTTVKDGTTSLHLRPLKRGNQYVLARLGGSTGPLLAMRKVWEFTIDTPALESTVINAQTGIGTTTLTVRPHVPNVDFNFLMAGHTATFAGGKTAFTINTSASQSSIGELGFQSVWDEATGEIIGQFDFDLEMPADEDLYCFTMQPTQGGTSSGAVSSRQNGHVPVGEKGLINGDGHKLEVDQIFMYKNANVEKNLTVTLIKKELINSLKKKKTKYRPKIVKGKGVPPKFSKITPIDCSKPDGTKFVQIVKPNGGTEGKYNVKIAKTVFSDRVVLFDVKINNKFDFIVNSITKLVNVEITQGAQADVDLTLSRTSGTAGEATFTDGSKKITIKPTIAVGIKGTKSSAPAGEKTVTLKAELDGYLCDSMKFEVGPVMVEFKENGVKLPNPFRMGISTAAFDRSRHLTDVITPWEETDNITLSVDGRGISLLNIQPSFGEIDFDVLATEATGILEPAIKATHSSGSVFWQYVSVVVPSAIGRSHPQPSGPVNGVNRCADAGTSPAMPGVPAGSCRLITNYDQELQVSVVDQFGETIGDLYKGSAITEYSAMIPINQILQPDSTYVDLVGRYEDKNYVRTMVLTTSTDAITWPTDPVMLLQRSNPLPQNIPVQVDGFSLNPAVINRQVITTPPKNVQIIWP